MPEFARETASRAPSHDQRLPANSGLRSLWGVDNQSGRTPRALLRRNRPGLAEPLSGSIGRRLDLGRLQRVGGDRQSASKRLEEYEERLPPLVGGGDTKLYRPVLKSRVVGRELVEP